MYIYSIFAVWLPGQELHKASKLIKNNHIRDPAGTTNYFSPDTCTGTRL